MPATKGRRVYVANTTFVKDNLSVYGGVTRVREGHELLKQYPHLFDPVDDAPVHYDVEAATQGPGEKRGDQ